MSIRYLEVTYRAGKPLAAYFYLPRKSGDKSVRVQEHEAGLIVDFTEDGRPMGVEITSPTQFSLEALNRVLSSLQLEPATQQDCAPLAPTLTAA